MDGAVRRCIFWVLIMAGHSKWANIRHRKERADKKKGKIFSRIAKEIISAIKVGGADPNANPRLRLILQKARTANVPNDVIERNIKKASSADQASYDEVTYELYGHGGVGIIAEGMTDNKNRLASDLRIATNKRGGTLASPGSVVFNFDRKGVIQIKKDEVDEDTLFLAASEAGAADFDTEENTYVILTDPAELLNVKEALTEKGFLVEEATLELLPKNLIECNDETERANQALIEWLEDIDDIDDVYHNMS